MSWYRDYLYRDHGDQPDTPATYEPPHECPTPLERPVDEFNIGGKFLSPAGRWEIVTAWVPMGEYSGRVMVYTDRTGPNYGWQVWRTEKFPYLPDWLSGPARRVVVFDLGHHLEVEVSDSPRSWVGGHTLVTARMERGQGWQVSDCPDGRTPNTVTVPSKARARAEVNRRARAHAKALGLALEQAPAR